MTENQIQPAEQNNVQLLLSPVYQAQKHFETVQRMAQMYTTSTIVPQTYRENLGNCVIAIDMAQRMQANPLMVMQNLYIVHGNPSFSSKFLIACINASGRYTPLRYEWAGKRGTDDYGCRCYAYEASDTEHKEPLYGSWVSIKMAKAEKWTDKAGSKWLTMPDQMLMYRAAAFWQRAYAPEISMGFLTKEEYEDADIIDEKSAEAIRDEENAAHREAINADAIITPAEPAEPAEESPKVASEPNF